jgi:hypothetical protein
MNKDKGVDDVDYLKELSDDFHNMWNLHEFSIKIVRNLVDIWNENFLNASINLLRYL